MTDQEYKFAMERIELAKRQNDLDYAKKMARFWGVVIVVGIVLLCAC